MYTLWNESRKLEDEMMQCHVCEKNGNVHIGDVPSTNCGVSSRSYAGTVPWKLCESCHDAGWIPGLLADLGRVEYWNHRTNENKVIY